MKQNHDAVEQLLESKSERPKGHILKSPKKPGAKEKNKVRRSARPSSTTSANKHGDKPRAAERHSECPPLAQPSRGKPASLPLVALGCCSAAGGFNYEKLALLCAQTHRAHALQLSGRATGSDPCVRC